MRVIAFVAAGWLAACSSKEPKRPAELGDCLPTSEMKCPSPVTGSGGSASSPDASAAAGDGSSSNLAGCGTADSLVVTMNLACRPCITMNCCAAADACSGACSLLLQCTQACQQDQICIGGCQNMWPTGHTAYQDFALCLSAMCTPACPALGQ